MMRAMATLERPGDRRFRLAVSAAAALLLLAVGAPAWQLASASAVTWRTFGLSFLGGSAWDPVAERFGAWPFLYGTAVSSLVALLIAVPLGVGSAVFLTELAPPRAAD